MPARARPGRRASRSRRPRSVAWDRSAPSSMSRAGSSGDICRLPERSRAPTRGDRARRGTAGRTPRSRTPASRQALVGRGPRLAHETEIRLDQRLHAALPAAVVGELHLLAKVAYASLGELERQLPVPAKPLEDAPVPQDRGCVSARPRAPPSRPPAPRTSRAPPRAAPGGCEAAPAKSADWSSSRAEALTQRELGAALEQARRHLARPHLDLPQTCDHRRQQRRVSDSLGLLERRSRVRQCPSRCRTPSRRTHARNASQRASARRPVPRPPTPARRAPSNAGGFAERRYRKLEQDVRSLGAGRNLPQQLLEQRLGPRQSPARRWNPRPVNAADGPVQDRRSQLRRQLKELRRRGGGPPRRGLLSRSIQLRGDDRVRSFRGEREMAGPLLDVGDHSGQRPMNSAAASTPAPARSRSTPATDAQIGPASRRARESPRAQRPRSTSRTRSEVPVRRRHQLDRRARQRRDLSRTSAVSAGSCARRPPSSSRRLSGTRRFRPAAGLACVLTSSRPSSSAKYGLPPRPPGRARARGGTTPGPGARRADDATLPGSTARPTEP